MKKSFTFFIIIFSLMYISVSVWSSVTTVKDKSVGKIQSVRINNQTQSLQVFSAEKNIGHLKIRLINNSNKNITSYVVTIPLSHGGIFRYQEEFLYSEIDKVIVPGESFEKLITTPKSLDKNEVVDFSLFLLIFDDKTYEGDQNLVQEIQDERLGEKIQFSCLIPLLDKMLLMPSDKLRTYLNQDFDKDLASISNPSSPQLQMAIRNMRSAKIDQDTEITLSKKMEEGIKGARDSFINKFSMIKNVKDNVSLRQEILIAKERYELIISKL